MNPTDKSSKQNLDKTSNILIVFILSLFVFLNLKVLSKHTVLLLKSLLVFSLENHAMNIDQD